MLNGVMCLNGERIVFRGVNRHEWNPATGRAIGAEDMRRAMATFRRNNINAVRTCHYPDQSMWYDLCDENGIYMIAEANLETHGTCRAPAAMTCAGMCRATCRSGRTAVWTGPLAV